MAFRQATVRGYLFCGSKGDFESTSSHVSPCYKHEWGLVESTASRTVLLSIPKRFLRQAVEASSIRVTNRLVEVTGDLIVSKDDNDVCLLEVSGEFKILNPNDCHEAQQQTDDADLWTLRQMARLESLMPKERSFSVGPTHIAAVSPLLAMESEDPFCLVEVVDDDMAAVVVLRGDSTRFRLGLVPGQCNVNFHRVCKQRWRVRESVPDAPPSVLVMDTSSHITFKDGEEPIRDTTVLFGTVHSVHWVHSGRKRNGEGSRRLNYLEVVVDEDTRAFVYLTHFPLSVSLQISLRVGALIEVRNLYKLGNPMVFAACLRSHLAVVEFSPRAASQLAFSEISSYGWQRRIKPTYLSLFAKRQIAKLVEESGEPSLLVSLEEMCDALVPTAKSAVRNAYAEFLEVTPTPRSSCPASELPSLVDLSEVVNRSFSLLSDRLRLTRGSDMSVGSTAGIQIDPEVFRPNCGAALSVFGRCAYAEERYGTLLLVLSNQSFHVPSVCRPYRTKGPQPGQHTWLQIKRVFVSCICIGEWTAPDDPNTVLQQPLPLPQVIEEDAGNSCCSIIVVNGLIFVAAIHIAFSELSHVDDCLCKHPKREDNRSVMECLGNPQAKDPRPIEALLVKSKFKSVKVKTSSYTGCTLTLCHTPQQNEEISTLQSIEIKPPVGLIDSCFPVLEKTIRSLCNIDGVPPERLALGAALWEIATNPMTSSLLLGGLESTSDAAARTRVWIPASAVQLDSKRGYCRFRCTMSELVAVTYLSNVMKDAPIQFYVHKNDSFIPGILDRTPDRVGGAYRSEIRTRHIPFSGIPQVSIRDLFSELTQDLNQQSRWNLRPSMVRQLHLRTVYLGISYCRAQAECAQCYSALTSAVSGGSGHLVCPNGCENSQQHNRIKWECSGIVDDGTGQAKLYAEREAALCLLGLSEKRAKYIEQGVWMNTSNAIVFSKSLAPKRRLAHAVEAARSLALAHRRIQKTQYRRLDEEEVLCQMLPLVRAEYLMEWHCRYSSLPHRRMVYFVRCKPLADGVVHFNQTEIELSSQINTFSYSFPPLKLVLLDCAAWPPSNRLEFGK